MKQINIAISVVLLLGATSCSQEEVINPADGDGNVTFTVSLPGDMSTRSFADGYSAKNLKVAVYNEDGTLVYEPAAATFNENALETTVSLDLAQGVAYKIAFFAYNAEAGGYEFNAVDKTVTAKYDAMAGKYNTDVFDCFYTLYTTEKLSGPLNANVMLTRPVAQVNWGTSDLTSKAVTAESAYGEGAKNLFTKVTTTIPSKLDLLTGDAKEGTEVTVEFPYLDRPAADEVYPVKPETFKYLSMQYLLVSKDASTVDLTFDAANSQSASKPLKTLTVSNVPVQANFRTNIYGALLTSAVDITVDKDNGFGAGYPIDAKDFDPSTLNAGGNVVVTKEVDAITVPTELAEPLNLFVSRKVSTINMPASNEKPITITVAKDVDYPEFVYENNSVLKDITIKGDPASNKTMKGVYFYEMQGKRPMTIENLTYEGIHFVDYGFNAFYSFNTKNIVIRNCKFTDMKKEAITFMQIGSATNFTSTDFTMEDCEIVMNPETKTNAINLCDVAGTINIKNVKVMNAGAHGIRVATGNTDGVGNVVNIIGCTVEGKTTRDGIKVEERPGATINVSNNTLKVSENGIRIKDSAGGNTITVKGNTIDMVNKIAWNENEREPWGILIIKTSGEAATATIIGTEADNTFTNAEHKFCVTNIKQ